MGDRDGNSVATEQTIISTELMAISTFPIKNDSKVLQFEEISKEHVSEDRSLKDKQNDEFESEENRVVAEDPDRLDETLSLDSPELDCNDIETTEYHCVTQFIYEPSYEPRKRKSSLAESDDSIEEDPEKKRLKCLQYIGLLIGGIFLSIIVIYYGRVDTEGFIDFDELRKLRNYT